MATNTSPIFTLTAHVGYGIATTANTAFDGSGANQVSVFSAATNGSRIKRITIQATGTIVAGLLNLWLYDGANYRLWKSIVTSAITASTTVAPFISVLNLFGENALELASGWSLVATTTISQNILVVAEGGDF